MATPAPSPLVEIREINLPLVVQLPALRLLRPHRRPLPLDLQLHLLVLLLRQVLLLLATLLLLLLHFAVEEQHQAHHPLEFLQRIPLLLVVRLTTKPKLTQLLLGLMLASSTPIILIINSMINSNVIIVPGTLERKLSNFKYFTFYYAYNRFLRFFPI
jgi:hypothetical protein